MAKKEETPKTVLERTYVIPLRMETLKAPAYRKAKKAITAVKQFIAKHMKSSDIKLGKYLNLHIWKDGIKNPPNKVKIIATKNDKGTVFVELVGAPKPQPKAEEPKKPAKKEEKIIKEAEFKEHKQGLAPLGAENPEDKLEAEVKEIKEEKAEAAKQIEKEEIKELQKEHPKQHAPKTPSQPKVQQTHPTAPKSV